MTDGLAEVREALLDWYAREKRDFPWRGTTDPYAVLVSEVMLQQTQASRIAERFPRFMARFPSVASLGAAHPADVLAEWSGLGYNRRALALRATAVAVSRDGWPRDVAGLELLPGVGPYTARAIASLAFGQPVGVVDTNVRRWLARRFGATLPAQLQALSDALAAAGDPRDASAWTHATMEFGARVCRGRLPACGSCPLAESCPAATAPPRIPVVTQPRFTGSTRAYRGAIVRLLAAAPGRRLTVCEAARLLADRSPGIGPVLGSAAFDRVVASLERDGLVSVERGVMWLGGGVPVESAAGELATTSGRNPREDAQWRS